MRQIRIYRRARPTSKTGKLRPPIIEIGDGVHRPRFYRYTKHNEDRIIAAIENLPMKQLVNTKYSILFVGYAIESPKALEGK